MDAPSSYLWRHFRHAEGIPAASELPAPIRHPSQFGHLQICLRQVPVVLQRFGFSWWKLHVTVKLTVRVGWERPVPWRQTTASSLLGRRERASSSSFPGKTNARPSGSDSAATDLATSSPWARRRCLVMTLWSLIIEAEDCKLSRNRARYGRQSRMIRPRFPVATRSEISFAGETRCCS